MAKKATQTEMWKQKKIAELEDWIDEADDKREIINGLEGEIANAELKIAELMHKNQALLSKEEHPKKGPVFVYRRGDYTSTIGRGKEKVEYKRKQASKGEPASGEGGDDSAAE